MIDLVAEVIDALLKVVGPELLKQKVDERAQIKAARAAADAAAAAKFGEAP